MANKTIYPYGTEGDASAHGIIPDKLALIENSMQQLAPIAFRGTPNYPNPIYKDVCIFATTTDNVANLRYGYTPSVSSYLMSPVYQLGEPGGRYNLSFTMGQTSTSAYPGLLYLDKDYNYYAYNASSGNPRNVTGDISESGAFYVRVVFPVQLIMSVWLKDMNTGEVLFRGAEVDLNSLLSKESFLDSIYWNPAWGPNSRGDWIGWNFGTSDNTQTSQRSSFNYPMFTQIGSAAPSRSLSISKMVELPELGIDVEFFCGSEYSGLMLRALNPQSETATYFNASEEASTVTIPGTYTHLQLYFRKENYADCYIKDATNNVVIWQGASSTD